LAFLIAVLKCTQFLHFSRHSSRWQVLLATQLKRRPRIDTEPATEGTEGELRIDEETELQTANAEATIGQIGLDFDMLSPFQLNHAKHDGRQLSKY
jgi:hypothetical protein